MSRRGARAVPEVPAGWELREVPLRKIAPSHAVERGRRIPARYLDTPIWITPRLLGGFRVHDGNGRLALAAARGDRTIAAYVWTGR